MSAVDINLQTEIVDNYTNPFHQQGSESFTIQFHVFKYMFVEIFKG